MCSWLFNFFSLDLPIFMSVHRSRSRSCLSLSSLHINERVRVYSVHLRMRARTTTLNGVFSSFVFHMYQNNVYTEACIIFKCEHYYFTFQAYIQYSTLALALSLSCIFVSYYYYYYNMHIRNGIHAYLSLSLPLSRSPIEHFILIFFRVFLIAISFSLIVLMSHRSFVIFHQESILYMSLSGWCVRV